MVFLGDLPFSPHLTVDSLKMSEIILTGRKTQIKNVEDKQKSGQLMTMIKNEPRHDKTNKVTVCPAKTQIRPGGCTV